MLINAGVAQRSELQFSKLVTRVRLPSPAHCMETLINQFHQVKSLADAEQFVQLVDHSLSQTELEQLETEVTKFLYLIFNNHLPNLEVRIAQIVTILAVFKNHKYEFAFIDKPPILLQYFVVTYAQFFDQEMSESLLRGKEAFDQLLD